MDGGGEGGGHGPATGGIILASSLRSIILAHFLQTLVPPAGSVAEINSKNKINRPPKIIIILDAGNGSENLR